MRQDDPSKLPTLRQRLHVVIFESDTAGGLAFDVILILAIFASILVVMLESVVSYREEYGPILKGFEWSFTLLFTVEYVLRLASVGQPARFARSFFGVVDLLSIVPTYLSVIVPGAQTFVVIRVLRVLRIFRVLKLAHYLVEIEQLVRALRASARKIAVFIFAVLTLVVIFGALMYLVEGDESGFTSIPRGMYWAIVTLTTVGYGDISPQTSLGQSIAAVIMILGYGIIAVPTGIVTAELTVAAHRRVSGQSCPECGGEGHDTDAAFCRLCGAKL